MASSIRPSMRNWPANWRFWPITTRRKGPSRRSWTCRTGKSISLSASVCRTMAGSPHGSAWTTSIFCRIKKLPAWNRPCKQPTKAKPRHPHEHGAFLHGNRHRDLPRARFTQGSGRPADRRTDELPPMESSAGIFMPGEPEYLKEQEYRQSGIPISPEVLKTLGAFAEKVGIAKISR